MSENTGPISAIGAQNSGETEDPKAPQNNDSAASNEVKPSITDPVASTAPSEVDTGSADKDTDTPDPTNGVDSQTSSAPSTSEDTPVQSAPVSSDSPLAPNTIGSAPIVETATSEATIAETQDEKITRLLLASMAPVGMSNNFKMMLYGDPGTAKSSWLGGAGNQLIYDQEDGAYAMKGAPRPPKGNILSVPFKSFQQAEWLIDRLKRRIPELDWVEVFSIDTFNDFADKSLDEIMANILQRQPSRSPIPDTDEYTENNRKMLTVARSLRDLDRNIILTCHSKTVEPKNKPALTYPAFSESLAKKLEAMMDIVAYVEWRDIEGERKPVFLVGGHPHIHAKNRIGLTGEFVDPTYDFFYEKWEEYRKAHPEAFEDN